MFRFALIRAVSLTILTGRHVDRLFDRANDNSRLNAALLVLMFLVDERRRQCPIKSVSRTIWHLRSMTGPALISALSYRRSPKLRP
jgi:hypothetical protein